MRLAPLLLALSALFTLSLASVLSLDYGTESLKVSLIKPGVPFDVVLDRDSKRKIHSTVAFKQPSQDRVFGAEAAAAQTRFPASSYSAMKLLLGKLEGESTDEKRWSAVWPSVPLEKNKRGTIDVRRPDGETFAVEEIVAMQFAYARELAEGVAGELVREAVVSIPAFFSTYERQAVLDALDLAGLRPLALVQDGTSVAINYAMTRTFPTSGSTHLIYDAGHGSLRATLAKFSSIPLPSKSKKASAKAKAENETVIQVKGYGFDARLGGLDLDHVLREIIAHKFEEQKLGKGGLDPAWRKNGRTWAKLLKEANRVKHILSANSEAVVAIESLYEELDLRTHVTRQEFEDAAAEYRARWTKPIIDALHAAGLEIGDVDSVIITGGASRIPQVQDAIRQLVGDEKIAQNVNADEAAVLGAAFYGASQSPLFRTKAVRVEDIAVYDLLAGYEKGGKPETTQIVKHFELAGVRRTIAFPSSQGEIAVSVSYGPEVVPSELPRDYLEARVADDAVAAALKNVTDVDASETSVEVYVEYTENGMVFVSGAELVAPPSKAGGIAGKLKGLFGGGKDKEKKEDEDKEKASNDTNATASAKATVEPEQPAEARRFPLTLNKRPLSLAPMLGEEKQQAVKRLRTMILSERSAAAREEARNAIEGHLYRLRDVVEDAVGFGAFHNHSAPGEIDALKARLLETLEWVGEHGDGAGTEEIVKRHKAVIELEQPIKDRLAETKARTEALSDLQKALFAGRQFVHQARQNLTAGTEERYTFPEIDEVERVLFETENWLRPLMRLQEARAPHEEPAYRAVEADKKGKTLQDMVFKLTKRKIAPKEKKEEEREMAERRKKEREAKERERKGEKATEPATEPTPAKEEEDKMTTSDVPPSKETPSTEHDEL